jgi:hypothetical protein
LINYHHYKITITDLIQPNHPKARVVTAKTVVAVDVAAEVVVVEVIHQDLKMPILG